MKKQRILYSYKIENLADVKTAEKKIGLLEGVISADVKDGVLVYEVTEWTDEYDVLTQSMSIIEELGGELIVGEDNVIMEDGDELSGGEVNDGTIDVKAVESDGNALNEVLYVRNESENYADSSESVGDDVNDNEDDSPSDKKKRLKTDVVSRIIELSLSVVLLILGLTVKGKEDAVIGIDSVFLIFGFAVTVYEVFYFAFISVIKKRFCDASIIVSLASLSMVLFGYMKQALIISLLFSVYKATKEYTFRYRELKLSEEGRSVNCLPEGENVRTIRIRTAACLLGVLLAVFSFFILIPKLKLTEYVVYFFSYAFALAIITECLNTDALKNAVVGAKSQSIDLRGEREINKLGSANAFEIDSSALINSDGELKDDAIGAMKELLFLGAKSLKTNFSGDEKESVKEQIDFVDKEFDGKKTVTVGKSFRDVNFGESANGVILYGEDAALIPKAFRLARRAKKTNGLSRAMSVIAVLPALCSAATLITGAFFLPLWLSVASFALLAVSQAVVTINLK